MKNVKSLLFLFCASLLVPIFCSAETVVLKSGEKVEGTVLEKTDKYIKIDIDGIPVTYFLDELRASAPSLSSNAPSSPAKKEERPAEDTAYVNFKKGFEKITEKKYQEAEDFFKRARDLSTAFEGFYYYAWKVSHDFNQGVITQETGLACLEGATHLVHKAPEQAIPVFEKVLQSNPTYAFIYIALGSSYLLLNQYEKALSYFQKGLSLDPQEGYAYAVLGWTYMFLSQPQQAKENILKAKEIFEKKGDYRNVKVAEDYLAKIPLK